MKIFLTGGSGFIGTNFVTRALEDGADVMNYDRSTPFLEGHNEFWSKGDILDREGVRAAMMSFGGDVVVHMAAHADCDENTTVEEGYRENTEGTRNVIEAVSECSSVKRMIVVSTQFVCGPGRLPEHDEDFYPHTVYGESKVQTEKIVREIDPPCSWTIVRPTNVWGPHHARYSREFWRIVSKGLYFQPDIPTPTRSYGYVGNVVEQILAVLGRPEEDVARKVFYVGDRPIDIIEWVDGFHIAIRGRKARRIPLSVIKGMATVGDVISKVSGKPFYINSSRLQSMMTDYLTPMDKTLDLLGEPKYSLKEGIEETSRWYGKHSGQRLH